MRPAATRLLPDSLPARAALAFVAGALNVLAFAPFNLPLIALPALMLLAALWWRATPRQGFYSGLAFGLGLFGFGIFWLRISIAQFGGMNGPLAVVLTLAFVGAMALYYGLLGGLLARWSERPRFLTLILPGGWVLGEWLRGHLFGGFPWLVQGYAQIDSPLAGFAPVLGVFGLSLALLSCVGGVVAAWTSGRLLRSLLLPALVLILCLPVFRIDFTESDGQPLSVALVQGNVPQQLKWQPQQRLPTLELYSRLTEQRGERLIVWPETAVPAFADQVEETLLGPLDEALLARGQSLLLGIPLREADGRYFNSLLLLGEPRRLYHKRHLVPFGEYLPFDDWLRPLLDWLRIPLSDFSAGSAPAPLMRLAGHWAALSICYEDAFGHETRQALPQAGLLINVSNDAWFGDSLAPHQHLQIARMRAAESGRPMLRATNTGISALIGPRGEVQAASGLNQQTVLAGQVQPRSGRTPWIIWGDWLALGLAGLMLLGGMKSNSA